VERSSLATGIHDHDADDIVKTRNPIATAIAIAFLSTVAVAGEPSDWYQSPLWHKSDPTVIAEGTPPFARVTLTGRSMAIIVGRVAGNGTISFREKNYQFKLSGISFFDIGAASVAARGEIYNLTAIGDLAGTYSAIAVGTTIGRGGSIAYLKNEHGVIIRLRSSTVGLLFNLSVDRVKITIVEI
jgi:hypothetical protein